MKELAYGDLSARIRSNPSRRRVPLYGMIEITRRWPLRCAHCFNNLPLADRDAQRRELTLAEHCRIVDEIAAAGCLWLTFTGGEIFAREDFLEIYAHAKSRGLLIILFTNGVLVTPEIADRLAAAPPHSIEISLYGVTAETHERVTGVPGSFERCLRSIRMLTDRKLSLSLKTMALTVNEHELGRMRSFVVDELGLRFRFDPMIVPRLDGSRQPLALRLAPRRVVELGLEDPKLNNAWLQVADRCRGGQRRSGEIYACNAGITGFGIDPYGGLNSCLFSPGGKYDLRSGSFAAGWEGRLREERGRKITRHTKCVDCGLREMCGMCPPNSELEQGDPEEPVDYFCEVAHLRAGALGVSVAPHGACVHCSVVRPV